RHTICGHRPNRIVELAGRRLACPSGGDSQLIRFRCAPPGCSSPLDPLLFQSSSTPSECPTTQGGFAAHPVPLRSAGLLLPPGPPAFPVVVPSFGVSDDPRRLRSSSGPAAL